MVKSMQTSRPAGLKIDTSNLAGFKPPARLKLRSALKSPRRRLDGSSDSTNSGKSVEWDPAVNDPTPTSSSKDDEMDWEYMRTPSSSCILSPVASDWEVVNSDCVGKSKSECSESQTASEDTKASGSMIGTGWDSVLNASSFDTVKKAESMYYDPAIVDLGPIVSSSTLSPSREASCKAIPASLVEGTRQGDTDGMLAEAFVTFLPKHVLKGKAYSDTSRSSTGRSRIPIPVNGQKRFPGHKYNRILRQTQSESIRAVQSLDSKASDRANLHPLVAAREKVVSVFENLSLPNEGQDDHAHAEGKTTALQANKPESGAKDITVKLNPRAPEFKSIRGTKTIVAPDHKVVITTVSTQENTDSLPTKASKGSVARNRVIYDEPRLHGREVDSFEDWYGSLQMAEFMKKYPMTGMQWTTQKRVRRPVPLPSNPAIIQQEIEKKLFLLKEKKAMKRLPLTGKCFLASSATA